MSWTVPTPPELVTPSATMTMKCFLPVRRVRCIFSTIASIEKGTSGTRMATAPQAMPACRAMSPQRRPMTSTIEQRSWDCEVSRSLSTMSMTVLTAVSKPIV